MRKLSIYIILCVTAFVSNAQDPGFSQYYATPMYVNPAFTGDKQGVNFSINNRILTNFNIGRYNLMQVASVIPFSADFMYKSSKIAHNSGVGIAIYNETTGSDAQLVTNGAMVSVAHSVQLQKQHFMALGFQAGYIFKSIGEDFQWGSQYNEDFGYDPSITPDISGAYAHKTGFPTVGAGIEYFFNSGVVEDYFKKFDFDAYTGFAVYNVNQPNQSFFEGNESRLPISFKYNAGIKYHFSKQMALFPTFLWIKQNDNTQINAGFYANIRTVKSEKPNNQIVNIIVGGWYRKGDSYIATVGFTVYDFKFAISYDFNASNYEVLDRGKGATEVSLKYSLPVKGRQRYSRGLLYPSF